MQLNHGMKKLVVVLLIPLLLLMGCAPQPKWEYVDDGILTEFAITSVGMSFKLDDRLYKSEDKPMQLDEDYPEENAHYYLYKNLRHTNKMVSPYLLTKEKKK